MAREFGEGRVGNSGLLQEGTGVFVEYSCPSGLGDLLRRVDERPRDHCSVQQIGISNKVIHPWALVPSLASLLGTMV